MMHHDIDNPFVTIPHESDVWGVLRFRWVDQLAATNPDVLAVLERELAPVQAEHERLVAELLDEAAKRKSFEASLRTNAADNARKAGRAAEQIESLSSSLTDAKRELEEQRVNARVLAVSLADLGNRLGAPSPWHELVDADTRALVDQYLAIPSTASAEPEETK